MPQNRAKTVFVAMSGGVDSSVAAALLKEQGFSVVGIFMKNWHADAHDANTKTHANGTNRCPWEADQESARMAAAKIGIPLYTWDFSKEYKEEVVNYMIAGYRRGETPNPDVMCNKVIKFGLFLQRAKRLGADYIATGHYVRLRNTKKYETTKSLSYIGKNLVFRSLLQAKDKNKDQSYFLWNLTQEQLKHCLFPIGEYVKPQVREMAKKFSLPNAERKDSQGLCFVGKVNFREFLKDFLPERPGLIIDVTGKVIGEHLGVQFYTIGQRHGIGIGGGQPYFVVAKDAEHNILHVARGENHPALYQQVIRIGDIHWTDAQEPELPLKAQARIRYRQLLQACTVFQDLRSKEFRVKFSKPQRAVAPGQSIVFYQGEKVLGGGVIENAAPETLIKESAFAGYVLRQARA